MVEAPKNNKPDSDGTGEPPESSDVREMGTGVLIQQLITGLLGRQDLVMQMQMMKMAAGQEPGAEMSLTYHMGFRKHQERLVALQNDCNVVVGELNARHVEIDLIRKNLMLEEQALKEKQEKEG